MARGRAAITAGWSGAVLALAVAAGAGRGQETSAPADDTKARIERLEAEVRELKAVRERPAGDPQADAPAPAGGDNRGPTAADGPPKLAVSWDAGGFRYKSA